MENEPLIDRVQSLLMGMEERSHARFDMIDSRLDRLETRLDCIDGRLASLETKLDSVSRLDYQLRAPFLMWRRPIEDEVSRLATELQDVDARLKKLESPPTQ